MILLLLALATPHSHNDYQQANPLTDALRLGYRSVEVDLTMRGGEVQASHWGIFSAGTLETLYLKPLRDRVRERGTVHGDGKPFYLWLEIRRFAVSGSGMVPALKALLDRYPIFSAGGPVVGILSGYSPLKIEFFERYPDSPLVTDDVDSPAPAVAGADKRSQWYSLRWGKYVNWDGHGEIQPSEREKLRRLVAAVHAEGKRVRFWGNPETPEFWRAMVENSVDLAGTDSLVETARAARPLKLDLASPKE